METPILSIAVPTYNRIEKLKLCLKHIIEQMNNKVELIVSDNALNDGIKEYMENLCVISNKVNYYRNRENLGPDANFLNCYRAAHGEYIIIISDDDVILPGMINNLLSILEKEKPVFMHLNHSDLLNDKPFKYGTPRLKEEGFKTFYDNNEFLDEVGIFITYISSLVMKTDLVKEIENKEQYIGSYFIQSHIALNVIKEEGKYIINTYNCLAASPNITVGYDVYYVWFENLRKIYFETGCKLEFDKIILENIYYRELVNHVINYIFMYRKRCKNPKHWNKKCVFENIGNNKNFKVVFILAVYSPICLLPFAKRIISLIIRINLWQNKAV